MFFYFGATNIVLILNSKAVFICARSVGFVIKIGDKKPQQNSWLERTKVPIAYLDRQFVIIKEETFRLKSASNVLIIF